MTKEKTPYARRAFWSVIVLLFILVMGMQISASLQSGQTIAQAVPAQAPEAPPAPTEARPPLTLLEQAIAGAPAKATDAVRREIGPMLDSAYAPAYAAIPRYADFHYSVLGEYAELTSAAMGDATKKIEEILLDGMEARLAQLNETVDDRFAQEYAIALKELTYAGLPEGEARLPLDALSEMVLDDAMGRMYVTLPLATATTIGTTAALKLAAAGMAKIIAKKVATKAAAKFGAKTMSTLAGFGGGALACAWAGPFAVGCGAVGALLVWVGVDLIVVTLDEYYNRDEFEADLRAMLDAEKRRTHDTLNAALSKRETQLSQAAPEIIERFRLQDHRATD